MSDDDDFSFDEDEGDTNLEHKPYDDRTAFGTSFDEQLAIREAKAREAKEALEASGPTGAGPGKGPELGYASTAMGPSFDERISQMGDRIAAMPPTDTPIAGVTRPQSFGGAPGAMAKPAPFPPANKPAPPPPAKRGLPPPARPLGGLPPAARAPAVDSQPDAPAQAGGFGSQPNAPAQPAGFGSQPNAPAQPAGFGSQPNMPAQPGGFGSQPNVPAQPGGFGSQPNAPQPMSPGTGPMMQDKQPLGGEEEEGALPKTVMLSPEDWAPAAPGAGQQPLNAAPFGAPAQPMGAPQQALAQPAYPHAAGAPHGQMAPGGEPAKKKKSNLVVFALSAIAVFLVSGVCVGGVVLYLLFNR